MTLSRWSLFVGRRPDRSRRYLALAVTLVPVTLVAYETYLHETLGGIVFFPVYVALAVLATTALHAYRNDGLLVCWALGVGPALGFDLYFYVLSIGHRSVGWGVANAATSPNLVVGVALATVGFLAGAGLRHAVALGRARIPS